MSEAPNGLTPARPIMPPLTWCQAPVDIYNGDFLLVSGNDIARCNFSQANAVAHNTVKAGGSLAYSWLSDSAPSSSS